MNVFTPERRALSVVEAAETCGVSRATLYRLIANGKLRTLKIGARRLVRPEAIEELLNLGVREVTNKVSMRSQGLKA
jgi:excisionase family DNA binding protein